MKGADYSIDLGKREVGLPIGGKYGRTIECPRCGRGAVFMRKYWSQRDQRIYCEYAHVLSFDLNRRNEPVMRAGDLCRWDGDPSPKASKGPK